MTTSYANLTYIAERLGPEATQEDAEKVANLAESIAEEQGDENFDLLGWLNNRTYEWTELWEAANGDVAALARVLTEAGIATFV